MTGRTAGAVLGWRSPTDARRALTSLAISGMASPAPGRARRRIRRQLFASPVPVHGSAPTLSKYSASVICRPSTSTGACRAAATRASLGSAARSAGQTLKKRATYVLAHFDRPGTSSGLTEAINGRLEHLRGSALGFRNLTNYIARSLLESGGFRTHLHPRL